MKNICKALFILLAIPASSMADETFSKELRKLYSFSPNELSTEEIDDKSKKLDMLWKKVETDKDKYLPILRLELNTEGNSPFFYYDGSKLLLHLSESDSDKKIALTAIPKTDLRDIDGTDYLLTIISLSIEGFDTSDAAFHILSYPDFNAFIVQHVLALGQDYSLVSMLMPLNDQLYVDKAIQLVKNKHDDVSVQSLIRVLWFADTNKSLKELKNIANSNNISKKNRELVSRLMKYDSNFRDSASSDELDELRNIQNISSNTTYKELKEIRRKMFNRISDEALIELEQLTVLMKLKRVDASL